MKTTNLEKFLSLALTTAVLTTSLSGALAPVSAGATTPPATQILEDFEGYETTDDVWDRWVDLPNTEDGRIKTELVTGAGALNGEKSLKISWKNITADDWVELKTNTDKLGQTAKYENFQMTVKSSADFYYEFSMWDNYEGMPQYWLGSEVAASSTAQTFSVSMADRTDDSGRPFAPIGAWGAGFKLCITGDSVQNASDLAEGYIILDDISTVEISEEEPEKPQEPTATNMLDDFESYVDMDEFWKVWELEGAPEDDHIKAELVTGDQAINGNQSVKISWTNMDPEDWCAFKTSIEKLGKTLKYDTLQMSVKTSVDYYHEFSIWGDYGGTGQFWPGQELAGSKEVQTLSVSLRDLSNDSGSFENFEEDWGAGFKWVIYGGQVQNASDLAEGYIILDDIRTVTFEESENPDPGPGPGPGPDLEDFPYGNPYPADPNTLGDFENITDVKALFTDPSEGKKAPWDIPGCWNESSNVQGTLVTGDEAINGQSLKIYWNQLTGDDWDSLKFYFQRAGKDVVKNAISLTVRAQQKTNLSFAIYGLDNGNVLAEYGQCYQGVSIEAGETKTIVLPLLDFISSTVGRLSASDIEKMTQGDGGFAFKLCTDMNMIGNDEVALAKPGYLIIDDVKMVDYVSPDDGKAPEQAKPAGNGQYVNQNFEDLTDETFEEHFGTAMPENTGLISLDKSGVVNGSNSLKWEFDFSGRDAVSSAFSFVPGAQKGDGLLLKVKSPLDMNLTVRLDDGQSYLVYTLPVKGGEDAQLLSCEWTNFTEAKGTFAQLDKSKVRMTVTLSRPDGADRNEYTGSVYLDDIGYYVYDEIENLDPSEPTNPAGPTDPDNPSTGVAAGGIAALVASASAILAFASAKSSKKKK